MNRYLPHGRLTRGRRSRSVSAETSPLGHTSGVRAKGPAGRWSCAQPGGQPGGATGSASADEPLLSRVPLGSLVDLAQQARAWLAFAQRRRSGAATGAKALESLILSLRLLRGAFAVPSKLVGTKAHQEAVRRLQHQGGGLGHRLVLTEENGRLAVYDSQTASPQNDRQDAGEASGKRRLGYVQEKHVAWLRPLLRHGVEVRLLAVTGDAARGHTHGVNVLFTGICAAVERFCRESAGQAS